MADAVQSASGAPGRLERLAALAGVVAVLLWVGGAAIIGTDHVGIPGGVPEEGADETLSFFRENESRVTAGSWIFMVGSLFFVSFAGVLRSRLTAAERGAGTFAGIAWAGGLLTGAFALAMPAGGLVAALAVDEISAPPRRRSTRPS